MALNLDRYHLESLLAAEVAQLLTELAADPACYSIDFDDLRECLPALGGERVAWLSLRGAGFVPTPEGGSLWTRPQPQGAPFRDGGRLDPEESGYADLIRAAVTSIWGAA